MNSQSIAGLKLPKLGQVGIVVKDIDKTMKYYERILGIGPWAVFAGEPTWCREKCGEVKTSGRIAMAQAGSVQIELIQMLEGGAVYTDLLGEGEGLGLAAPTWKASVVPTTSSRIRPAAPKATRRWLRA